MVLRRAKSILFSPSGVCDTLDATVGPPGAMANLINLIPDPSSRNLFQCRPAAVSHYTFGTFTTPGFVSVMKIIGTIVYGMIASGRNAGHDEPFAYDLQAAAVVTVSGTITSATTPVSPSSAYVAWTPPTMDLVGVTLLVTHPGFPGGAGAYFGWFDLTNPSAPVWHAGNTTGTLLSAVPRAVAQFANRAWYAVGNAIYFSDVLVPLNLTNASQILTLGDITPVTALAGLPLNNQLGGIIQSLIAFKDSVNMFQITGDAASTSSPLALNAMNQATGTAAPNTITKTPNGLSFISPQGLRNIDFDGHISSVIGGDGDGMTTPFLYATVPSRMCAAYSNNTIRVSCQNAYVAGTPWQDWWYDIDREIWTGPHTFPASLIVPYNNSFIMTPQSINANIFQSDAIQSTGSVFTENGTPLAFIYQTSFFPDTREMAANAVIESTINMATDSGARAYNVTMQDTTGAALGVCDVGSAGAVALWGHFIWGAAAWGAAGFPLSPRWLKWSAPVVFNKASLSLNGMSGPATKLGALYMRYQILKYLQQSLT